MKKKKNNNRDFDIKTLPRTRKEQFKDIVANNILNLLKIGLTIFVFCFPLLAGDYFRGIIINNFNNSFTNGEISKFELFAVINIGYIFDFILLIIFIIGLSGILKIYKELIWQEGIIYFHDFIKGIKENFKGFIKIGLLLFILFSLMNNIAFFINNEIVNYFIYAIMILIIFPSILYMFFFENYYSNTLTLNLKNGFIYSFRNYFISILFEIIYVVIFGINYLAGIINMGLILIFIILLIFVILPLYFLTFNLYVISLFDKYINIRLYKDHYRKGLYQDGRD